MGRAAAILAASEQSRPGVSAVPVTPVGWYRRPIAWPGFALLALAILAVPAALKMAGDGATIAVKPGDPGDTFSRGIVATPDPAKKKDAQSCIDANEHAGRSVADAARAPAAGARRQGEATTENNDPCPPITGR